MNTYIFVGPTLSPDEARKWLKAEYLPPVAQGDIISLLRKQPGIIGIIDGYFDSVPAVWHKEILLALSQGVHVIGGASMGALRAAELHPFGMIGVGEIFEWYRDGKIEADDEVAVQHASAEDGYLQKNEPLVNIRKTLEEACTQGVISSATLTALIAAGRNTSYFRRSYESLLCEGVAAGLPRDEILKLEKYLPDHKVDLKKRDAIKVLAYIADLEKTKVPLQVPFQLQNTEFLDQLIDCDQTIREVDGIRVTSGMLADHVRLENDDFLGLRDRAIANMLVLAEAGRMGVTITDAERLQGVHEFRRSMKLATDAEAEDWARRNDLNEKEFAALQDEWVLIRKMKFGFLPPDNRTLIRQLRLEGNYDSMVNGAAEKEKAVSSHVGLPEWEGVSDEELFAYYSQQMNADLTPESVRMFAGGLGMEDWRSLILALRKYYIFHKTSQ